MRKAHREDHRRSPQDIAARSRRMVWIPASTRLAKSIASHCYHCRANDKRMARQQMGSLPDERTTMLAPFEALALDLFGPYKVKDAAKGRRSFKCWVVAFICLATKAACLLACPGIQYCGIPGRVPPVFRDIRAASSGLHRPRPEPDKGGRDPRLGGHRGCDRRDGDRVASHGQGLLLAERARGETNTSRPPHAVTRVRAWCTPRLPPV